MESLNPSSTSTDFIMSMPVLTADSIEFSNSKASAKVQLHGATVISWKVAGNEKLFVSSKCAC